MSAIINPSKRAISGYPGDDRWMLWDGTNFRPYTDVAEALANVPAAKRHKGLFAIVGDLLYWYVGGVADENLVSFTAASAGAVWGVITGTLSDQTDLAAALALKLNVSDYNPKFKGKFATLAALEDAFPTASPGDSAQVTDGTVWDNYMYDAVDGWVLGAEGSDATNTDELPEGSTNKYYTDTRARAAISGASPRIKVSSGGVIDLDAVTTDDISEGSKKFYTDARARAAVSSAVGGVLSYDQATGTFSVTLPAGLSLSGTSPIDYDPATGIISIDLSALDARYIAAEDEPTFSTGLQRDGNDVAALVSNAIWNANKLQGLPISSEGPQDGDILTYDSTLGTWVLSKDWVPDMPEYANNTAALAGGLAVGKMYKLPYDATNDWQLTAIVH